MSKRASAREEKRKQSRRAGMDLVENHALLSRLLRSARIEECDPGQLAPGVWAEVDNNSILRLSRGAEGTPQEWSWVIGHALLHLGLGHLREHSDMAAWNLAADLEANALLGSLWSDSAPPDYRVEAPPFAGTGTAEEIYERLVGRVVDADVPRDIAFRKPMPWMKLNWSEIFAQALRVALSSSLAKAASSSEDEAHRRAPRGEAARSWLMVHFPLLARLAAGVTIVESASRCDRLNIQIAAVDAYEKTIYINPRAGLSEQEWRFVFAHELLHLGLRHDERCGWRDPYLWNIATDITINNWLVEMQVGQIPVIGIMHDPELSALSSEEIYEQITGDLRKLKRLSTFAGRGRGDVLGSGSEWWKRGLGLDLDAFYRESLVQGLELCDGAVRGLLPENLVEEIRSLAQPPIPWDVRLAYWFDQHFPPLERRLSYFRPSRRQQATPDIPRPRYVDVEKDDLGRTFCVLLDTSASMDRSLLGKALGSIASYAAARDVARLRLVYCDAAAHDAGWIDPIELGERVSVKGRGGTVLQPGVEMLERFPDLPKDAPLLVITDGWCDVLRIRREHAYLTPRGARLPFSPRGPVFGMK